MIELPESRGYVERALSLSTDSSWLAPSLATLGVLTLVSSNRKVAWLVRGVFFGLAALAWLQSKELSQPSFVWIKLAKREQPRGIDTALEEWLACRNGQSESKVDVSPVKSKIRSTPSSMMEEVSLNDSEGAIDSDRIQAAVHKNDRIQAWNKQVPALRSQLLDPSEERGVGLWYRHGRLQAVIVIVHPPQDMNASFFEDGEQLQILNLVTAPWNLGKRSGAGSQVLERTCQLLRARNPKVEFGLKIDQPPAGAHDFLQHHKFENRHTYWALSAMETRKLGAPEKKASLRSDK